MACVNPKVCVCDTFMDNLEKILRLLDEGGVIGKEGEKAREVISLGARSRLIKFKLKWQLKSQKRVNRT